MKKLVKRVLTLALALACLFAMSAPAYAATSKLKVTYKGTTAVIMDTSVTGEDAQYATSYEDLKAKWGEPTSTDTSREPYVTYTYKSGKSTVKLVTNSADETAAPSYIVTLKDSKMKLNGIYVGMKKANALKSLKNTFGSKNVTVNKSQKKIYVQYGYFMPIEVSYNAKGKITKIYFFCS